MEQLKSKAEPNPLQSLSLGLVDPDTRVQIREDGIDLSGYKTDRVLLTGLSVTGYPSDYALAFTNRFIGHKALDITCTFLVT